MFVVKSFRMLPLYLYATQIFNFSIVVNISSFVNATESITLIITAYFPTNASNHPILLGLPVVAPNSFPIFWIFWPTVFVISVGKGPLPTLVLYALQTPITLCTFFGGIPRPVQTPPVVQF